MSQGVARLKSLLDRCRTMSLKTVVTLVLLVVVGVAVASVVLQSRESAAGIDLPTARKMEPPNGDPVDSVVAFYLHGTMRCVTCKKLEAYSREAFEGSNIVLEVVNVDLPENRHFVDDFQLVTRALVLAEYRSGRITRWANLDRIWELVGVHDAYLDYVRWQTVEFEEGTDG